MSRKLRESSRQPSDARSAVSAQPGCRDFRRGERNKHMFCSTNGGCWIWIILLIIILLWGCGGSFGCNTGCGDTNCGCNNKCGCGC